MKRMILSAALLAASFTMAEAQSAGSSNEQAVKNYDGTAGHFEYALNSRERVNVTYTLTPRNPVHVAHFMIHTPDPMPFSATIVDASGKTVYRWKPQQQVYQYQADWDIAALKSGAYIVKVFLENEAQSIYEFPFSKP